MKEIFQTYTNEMYEVTGLSEDEVITYFNQGHPVILLGSQRGDAWILLLNEIERTTGEVYDQNGGEFDLETLQNINGKITIKYTLYDISIDEEDVPKNYTFEIEGFFVEADEIFDEFFVTSCKYYL